MMARRLPPLLLAILAASIPGQSPADSGGAVSKAGPEPAAVAAIAAPDSARKPLKRADTVLVVRHEFNHREQIIAGGVIMACLAGMLVVMNNYNPR
jgi:hypothetical protein